MGDSGIAFSCVADHSAYRRSAVSRIICGLAGYAKKSGGGRRTKEQ